MRVLVLLALLALGYAQEDAAFDFELEGEPMAEPMEQVGTERDLGGYGYGYPGYGYGGGYGYGYGGGYYGPWLPSPPTILPTPQPPIYYPPPPVPAPVPVPVPAPAPVNCGKMYGGKMSPTPGCAGQGKMYGSRRA